MLVNPRPCRDWLIFGVPDVKQLEHMDFLDLLPHSHEYCQNAHISPNSQIFSQISDQQ